MYFFLILLFISNIFGDYGGGYAGSGFRYSSNAREFALSNSIIADINQGFYAFSNPALFQYTKSNHVGISFQALSLDRYIQTYTFEKKLPPNAGIGLSILRSGTKSIQGRDALNQKTELFNANESEGIISFGVGFGRKISIGINIKVLFASIYDDYKGNGLSSDFGLHYKLNRNLLFGFMIKNINAKYTWQFLLGEDNKSYYEELPLIYSLGLASYVSKEVSIFFQEDIITLPGDDVNYRVRFGAEFKLYNKIKLRIGAKQSTYALPKYMNVNQIKFKPSVGFGSPFKIWKKKYINLDYALDLGHINEGFSHLFSTSFKF